MVNIKESIELLLKILQSFGFSRVKAEDFRLAKFDHDSASRSAWRLLFETLYFLQFGCIDEVCYTAFEKFSSAEVVAYIKHQLQRVGFLSPALDALPTNMSRGSRELLLAFGWLACKECLIQKFYTHSISPLEETETSTTSKAAALPNGFTSKLMSESVESKSLQINNSAKLREGLKQMVWLNGKLRVTLRQLRALQMERFKLSHQVNKATAGLSLEYSGNKPHLSPFEVFMLKHPSLLRHNLELLEKDNERLLGLLKWRDFEDEFWRWMESVLDLKIEEPPRQELEGQMSECSTQNSTTSQTEKMTNRDATNALNSPSTISSFDVRELSDAHKRLHDSLIKFESIAELLENQWATRQIGISQSDLELMISAVDAEIELFIRSVVPPKISSRPPLPNFLFDEEGGRRLTLRGLDELAPRDIGQEAARLEGVLTKLEEDVERNYRNFTKELETMSTATNSLVLFDSST